MFRPEELCQTSLGSCGASRFKILKSDIPAERKSVIEKDC
jgi:hypothetical protein